MMLFLAEETATLEDPSWLKTTSREAKGFAGVMNYRDNTCNSDIFYLDDEEDVVCASALCASLITIS
jgi:hypothetical protein